MLLERLLTLCAEQGWLKQRGRQRTDSTSVVGAVKALNILELVGETLRHALNILATVAPEWLRVRVPIAWFDRYGERIEDYRLPKEQAARDALSVPYGEDGWTMLDWLDHEDQMDWLREVPAVQTLRQEWEQQYRCHDGQVERLTPKDMIATGDWIRSPYDRDVRSGKSATLTGSGTRYI